MDLVRQGSPTRVVDDLQEDNHAAASGVLRRQGHDTDVERRHLHGTTAHRAEGPPHRRRGRLDGLGRRQPRCEGRRRHLVVRQLEARRAAHALVVCRADDRPHHEQPVGARRGRHAVDVVARSRLPSLVQVGPLARGQGNRGQ